MNETNHTMCGFYLDLDSNKETKNKKYKVTGNWNT